MSTRLSNTITALPTIADLSRLPVAEAGRYNLTEREIATLRQRLYALNRDNVRGWRWRSTKFPASPGLYTLLVWRLT